MPSRAFAVVRILRTGRRNMPSARTPDPAPAGSSRRSATSPSPAGKAGPVAGPPSAGPPSASPLARAPAPVPAFGGLRLIEVPGGWPPYDCEVHGTACPAAREVSVPSPCAQLGAGSTRRCRSSRSFSHVQRGPPRRRAGGSRRRMVQAVRPGNRRNPGRRPVAETTRSLDDRTGPGPDQPPDPDPYPGPEAQDPADRDIAPGRARGGDDRRAQFRAAVPRAGAAPGAAARPPARARAACPPGAVALHRDRGRLVGLLMLLRPRFHSDTISITVRVRGVSWNAMKPRIHRVLTQ